MIIEGFKNVILNLFRNSELISETNELLVFKINNKNVTVQINEINDLLTKLDSFNSEGETDLYDENQYEILVRHESRMPLSMVMREREKLTKQDDINGLHYELSPASNLYVIKFLSFILENNVVTEIRRKIFIPSSRIERYCDEEENIDLFELLRLLLRIDTIKINSSAKKNKVEFEKLCYSYIYNLGLNLDFPIYPLRFFEEFASRARIRMRRANPDEIEPPKRFYVNDLVLYYQRAISSESLDNQFLSFYHILEHFFDGVYNEELISSIQKEISKGTFSYKREKDIKKLIEVIKQKLKYKNEEFLLQEDEALILTLKKFINNIESLKDELNGFDPDLINYYKTTEVIFSKGNKVNFDVANNDEVFKNLANRIYLTRNAIVHSKETGKEKNKYLPFTHDRYLIKENILMRIIAESVIFESSKEI